MSERTRAESTRRELADAAPRPVHPLLRSLNGLLFGGFAVLGIALVARPALLFWKSLGMLAPVLPWDVPLGRLFFALALGLVFETLRLGLAVTAGARLRARDRVLLLLLVIGALAARSSAGEPLPPSSPVPRLVSALRATAEALDRDYPKASRYAPESAALDGELAALGSSYFVYRGHEVPLHVHLVEPASAAQGQPLPGDLPGTVYVALSADRKRAFLSALTLDPRGAKQILRTPNNRTLLIEARAGTHSAPGRDVLVPEYPGMRSLGTKSKGDGPPAP